METGEYAATALRRIGLALMCLAGLTVASSPAIAATSVFESAPSESRAVTVQGKGDGRADDTDAIQRALDQAAEAPGGGIVFLPSGRYRISRTILVWPAVRLLGTGRTRPVL